MGENALLQQLLRDLPTNREVLVGPGDDCAVVQRNETHDSLLKTDVVVEGVHFTRETTPELIGRKALARAVSDIAAMGGVPEHALVTLLVDPQRPVELLRGLYRGMSELAKRYHIAIAGGETSSLPYDGLVINIALTGRVEKGKAILRSGGKPNDLIVVSGHLGGSFESGRHLSFEPRVDLARRLMENELYPGAMMDLSDGLGTDLPRLAKASGCGFNIIPSQIPCHIGCSTEQAISDGEDYELLMTFSPGVFEKVQKLTLPVPLSCIGNLTPNSCSNLVSGWQHFSA